VRASLTAVCSLMLLSACVSSRPDHFYILSALPQGAAEVRPASDLQAIVKVTLPSWADGSEMLLNTPAGEVIVLEHERWAAPLADLMRQTLGVDIERRRADLTVADRYANLSKAPAIVITVDVVQMTVHRGERARIEVRWRIHDPRSTGLGKVGGGEFAAALAGEGYASIAQALSECLGALADRLVQQLQ
jgi:uncharacterized lipoprotein YmbA